MSVAPALALLIAAVAAGAAPRGPRPVPPRAVVADVCIYGGTAAGVVAAVQVRRMGGTAVLVEPGRHLGGLTAGGLGATDTGNRGAIGGLSREFYRRVREHYLGAYGPDSPQAQACSNGFRFEPHVAEGLFETWVAARNILVYRGHWLSEVRRRDGRIVELRTEEGLRVRAGMFIDATYEGDLLAAAGVRFTVGREANSVYGETLNGVQPNRPQHNFAQPVDPYRVPEDPSAGLLPGVWPGPLAERGTGDERVQAYNFRMCLTQNRANLVPFPKPDGYDPMRYELLARYLRAGVFDALRSSVPMPNGKTDTNNNGAFSTDNIGMNYAWPTADRATRERIFAEHRAYQQGLCWFLAHDPRVPPAVRAEVSTWGLAADEFVDTGHWPHQLYVREGRRMISDVVITEHHCRGAQGVDDPVGLASYNMDSHNTQRIDAGGRALNEGDVQVGVPKPYGISYRAIVPRQAECANLLVPISLSCSHIAYGSIRMEPVFMVLGQSAGTAAMMALRDRRAVQEVDYAELRARLEADGQIVEWTAAAAAAALPVPEIKPSSLPGIVLDDRDGEKVGEWLASSMAEQRLVGVGYIHEGHANLGGCAVIFRPELPRAGLYEIRVPYFEHSNRASNALITIETAGRATVRWRLNQRLPAPGGWRSLGLFELAGGRQTTVTISNADADGHVVVDGIAFVPAN